MSVKAAIFVALSQPQYTVCYANMAFFSTYAQDVVDYRDGQMAGLAISTHNLGITRVDFVNVVIPAKAGTQEVFVSSRFPLS